MCQQLVDLLRQRANLDREFVTDASLVARANVGDLIAHSPQWPQAVESLQCSEDEQSDAEREEAPEQSEAQAVDLFVDGLTRLDHLEAPADWGAR